MRRRRNVDTQPTAGPSSELPRRLRKTAALERFVDSSEGKQSESQGIEQAQQRLSPDAFQDDDDGFGGGEDLSPLGPDPMDISGLESDGNEGVSEGSDDTTEGRLSLYRLRGIDLTAA